MPHFRSFNALQRRSLLRLTSPSLLSTTVSTRPTRPSALSKPHQTLPSHAFHTTPRRRSPDALLTALLAPPHAVLTTLHTTLHLPYWAALPALALLLRATVLLPLLQLPQRAALQRLLLLTPLRHARASALRARLAKENPAKPPNELDRMFRREMATQEKELRREMGVGRGVALARGLAQVPVFLIVAETVRRMAGAQVGLLGLMGNWFGGGSSSSKAESEAAVAAEVARDEVAGAAGLGDVVGAEGVVDAVSATTTEIAEAAAGALAEKGPWFDPDFATDGLFWFRDLTLPDPTLNLPFLVAGLMMANVSVSAWRPGAAPAGAELKTRQGTVARRVLQTVLLLMAPLLVHVPAGVLWYWASSTAVAMMTNLGLELWRPLRRPPAVCRRPLVKTEVTQRIPSLM